MSFQSIKARLTGVAPLLVHNGHLADPLNPYAKAMKEVSGKRKKTDADHEELARLEFEGGLYLDDDKRPIIPSYNLEACLINGAKQSRLGKQFLAGAMIPEDSVLIYSGPKTVEGLWADKRFVDRRAVRIQKNKIIRTRPVFSEWSVETTIEYNTAVLDRPQIVKAISAAGQFVGLCDYTPKYGRFEVELI